MSPYEGARNTLPGIVLTTVIGRELPDPFGARGEPKPPLRQVDLRTAVDPSRTYAAPSGNLRSGRSALHGADGNAPISDVLAEIPTF